MTTVPGSVNAHTHLYSGLAALGMPAPDPAPESFPEILERVWWRLDRALDRESLRASARLYAAESLLLGTTTLIDHHESPEHIDGSLDVLADACAGLGMRAVLCYGATERNGGREEAKRGLAECRRFLESNDRPEIRGAVGLHASFTVSDDTIREAGELARELETVVHVHVAEDECDVRDAAKRGWPGPLERLEELGALPAGSILAHGVRLDAAQVRRTNGLGVWIVQNPRSNRGNRVGYPLALGESDRVALGTDGYPSNLADERTVLLEEARRHGENESVAGVRSERAYELVAERFGMEFSAEKNRPAAWTDPCRWSGRRLKTVTVAGRVVVRDGKLVTGDIDSIREEAHREAARLWDRMAALT